MYTPPSKLFASWLAVTKEVQEKYFLKHYGEQLTTFEDMTEAERISYIKEQMLAIDDEVAELRGEMAWKPWASASFLNREAAIGEAVDGLHFYANILSALECTDDELNESYREKLTRNVNRQLEGYTGTNKCLFCRRAFDDIDKHDALKDMGIRYRTDQGVSCVSCARERGYLV